MKRLFFPWLFSFTFAQAGLEPHVIDVGQGNAVLIRFPPGQNVLYDGGRGSDDTLTYLRYVGVQSLDLEIASHADADHISGLADVVSYYRPRFRMDIMCKLSKFLVSPIRLRSRQLDKSNQSRSKYCF